MDEVSAEEVRITRPPQSASHLDISTQLRMVVLGASRTGKTQLMSRFMGEAFSDTYMPTVEEYYRKMYTIRGKVYQLDVLETAGMSSNSINQNITLMTGDVYLIVYSIANAASFETAKELALTVERNARQMKRGESKHAGLRHWNCKKKAPSTLPVIIAGNKSDLEDHREVAIDDVYNWLMQSQPEFFNTHLAHIEVSAKEQDSVQRLFEMVFSTAHLPVEMSPSMHRKVSTNTFMESTSRASQKRLHESNNPKVFHRKKAPHVSKEATGFNNDAPKDTIFEEAENSDQAFAVVCPNQRRPSTATEFSLAMNKAKSTHSHYIPKGAFSPFQKLKKTICRATSSHI